MSKESKRFQVFWILKWMSYMEKVWVTMTYGIMLELFACSTCFNLLSCNVCFEELDISCHLPFFMAIYQLRKIICLFCFSHWESPKPWCHSLSSWYAAKPSMMSRVAMRWFHNVYTQGAKVIEYFCPKELKRLKKTLKRN